MYIPTYIVVAIYFHKRKLYYCVSIIGDVIVGGSEVKQPKGHYTKDSKPKNFDVDQIFVSPSIKYSGCSVYAKSKS